jgi:hypothetical protein
MGKDAWWSVPLAVLIGVPMYTNAAGVIPIVQALLAKGAALGTVLAFMMSVIALSLPEMIILRKVLKLRLIATFVGWWPPASCWWALCSTRAVSTAACAGDTIGIGQRLAVMLTTLAIGTALPAAAVEVRLQARGRRRVRLRGRHRAAPTKTKG